jgi:hypothetical protein
MLSLSCVCVITYKRCNKKAEEIVDNPQLASPKSYLHGSFISEKNIEALDEDHEINF